MGKTSRDRFLAVDGFRTEFVYFFALGAIPVATVCLDVRFAASRLVEGLELGALFVTIGLLLRVLPDQGTPSTLLWSEPGEKKPPLEATTKTAEAAPEESEKDKRKGA